MVRVNRAATRPIIESVTVRCHTFDPASGQQHQSGDDYTSVNVTPTFMPSDLAVGATTTNVTKPCEIPIIDDTVNEGQEKISVVLADPTGDATHATR